MAGSKEGGIKAAQTNKERYGDSFYAKLGSKGGSAKVSKGFAKMDIDRVKECGRIGGRLGKRKRASEYL